MAEILKRTEPSPKASHSGRMLKIQRSSNGEVIFRLTGRLNEAHVAEMEALLWSEAAAWEIVLDLKDLTLVDRDAVRFLERCEADGMKLKNCPAYIREWIRRGRGARWRFSSASGVSVESTADKPKGVMNAGTNKRGK
jgi:hypothetical protein